MKIPEHIKNVIFDFGAVILDIDGQRTIDAFAALGVPQFNTFKDFLYTHAHTSLFVDIEIGAISPDVFRESIRQWSGQPQLTDTHIDHAWNAMLVGYRMERLQLLESLKHKYRTFLLSNTNIIHWQHFTAMLEPFGYEGLHQLFEKDYYSHTLKMRKPHRDIYERVLQDAGINANETLFLDDNAMNIEGARKLGIQCIQVTPENDMLSIFDEFIEKGKR
jgi:putative hydrolase of the HAD superfamily